MIVGAFKIGDSHYQLEEIKCGKRGCRRCPHGPYWYRYFRSGGRRRKEYLGLRLPAGVAPPESALEQRDRPRLASPAWAARLLDLAPGIDYYKAHKIYVCSRSAACGSPEDKAAQQRQLDLAWRVYAAWRGWL